MPNRRTFVGMSGAILAGALAGCAEDESPETDQAGTLQQESEANPTSDGEIDDRRDYGYDHGTTGHAADEPPLDGWAQLIWQTDDSSVGVGRAEPFTPVPLSETVLVEGGHSSHLRAVDNETGTERWRRRLSDVRDGSIRGDVAYVTSDDTVAAVSVADGAVYWQAAFGSDNNDEAAAATEAEDAAGVLPGARATVVGETLFVSGGNVLLQARDAATGELRWTYGDSPTPGTPAVHDDRVYVWAGGTVHAVPVDPAVTAGDTDDNGATTGAGNGNGSGDTEADSDAGDNDGELPTVRADWTRTLGNVPSSSRQQFSVVVDPGNGLVIVVTEPEGRQTANHVRALDHASGDDVWTYSVDLGPITGRPAVAADNLYIGTENGAMAVDYSDAAPTSRWVHETATPVSDAPTVVGDQVYITIRHGEVRALDRSTGATRWATVLEDETPVSPIVADKRLYVPTESGTVALEHHHEPGLAQTGVWGDQRGDSGRTRNAGARLSVADRPELAWERGYRGGPPVIADGIAVFETNEVTAVDSATGTAIWQARPASRGGVRGVAADSDRVYAAAMWDDEDDDGALIAAYDLQTGAKAWTHSVSGEVYGGPTLADGVVHIGTERQGVIRLAAASGDPQPRLDIPRTVWRFAIDDGLLVTGIGAGQAAQGWDLETGVQLWRAPADDSGAGRALIVDDGEAYVSQAGGDLYALETGDDAATIETGGEPGGSRRWERTPPDGGMPFDAALGPDRLYMVETFSGGGDAVWAVSRSNGTTVWHRSFDGDVRAPTLVDGLVVVTVDDELTVLDTADGTVAWAVPLGELLAEDLSEHQSLAATGIAAADDGLYVATDERAFKFITEDDG